MAEASCAEIDSVLGGHSENLTNGRWGEEGHLDQIDQPRCGLQAPCGAHQQVLEQGITALQMQIGASGEVSGLLEKDGLWPVYLASINGYFLWDKIEGE